MTGVHFHSYSMRNLHFFCIIFLLLMLGNIETNPGPNNNTSFTKPLSIVHNNVCSLLPKLDIITAELSMYDIITISETHLDDSINNESIQIDGFHPPIRNDRNRYGGGVAIYISDKLSYYERTDLSMQGLEIVWSEIQTNNKKFLIGTLYRPPSSLVSYWDLLARNLNKVLDHNLPTFLLGDFNTNVFFKSKYKVQTNTSTT